MCQFYSLYPELKIANQTDSQLDNAEITNQLDSQFIFSIPWGHHKVIMSKCKGDTEKANAENGKGEGLLGFLRKGQKK